MNSSEQSFRSEKYRNARRNAEEDGESAASAYLDYLDNARRNYSALGPKLNERSESYLFDRSVVDNPFNHNFDNSNVEEIHRNDSLPLEYDLEL